MEFEALFDALFLLRKTKSLDFLTLKLEYIYSGVTLLMSHLRKRIILWTFDFLDFIHNLKKQALIINLFAENVLLLPSNCGGGKQSLLSLAFRFYF